MLGIRYTVAEIGIQVSDLGLTHDNPWLSLMTSSLLFPLYCLVFSLFQPTESLRYQVLHGDDTIGVMVVKKWDENGYTKITVDTKIELKLVLTMKVHSTYETQYKNGEMVAAKVRTYHNDKLHSYTNCWRGDGKMQIDRDGHRSSVPMPIRYTIGQTYFQPPNASQTVFSERWGKYQPFKDMGDGRFVQHLVNGDKSFYRYEGRLCSSIEVDTKLATLRLVRQ